MVSLALGLLLALMLVPALAALRRSEEIYKDIRASQQQFQDTQRIFEGLSQNVFTISIIIREFLLDNSPDAGSRYRSRLSATREHLQTNVARLRAILPSEDTGVLQQLQREVDAYVGLIPSIFEWSPKQRAERGVYFLREEQRPRRESILAVADKLAELNSAVYAEQQRQTTESERRFRDDLTRSALFAVLAGILVSAGGLIRMRQLERRAYEQHQRAEQTSEEMRNLSVQLRHAQEEDRRTISRELHDDVGQKLTAMRMQLGTLERLRAERRAEFSAALAEVKDLAEQSLRLIRDIATGLRPSVLDDLGLGAALQKQAREFSARTGIRTAVTVDGEFETLGDRQRTYVYRIVQEALTNCAKHADARESNIVLTDRDGHFGLTVTDDGIGFDRTKVGHAGLGLIGIEERVRELNGSVAIVSAPGQGTRIEITIPRQS